MGSLQLQLHIFQIVATFRRLPSYYLLVNIAISQLLTETLSTQICLKPWEVFAYFSLSHFPLSIMLAVIRWQRTGASGRVGKLALGIHSSEFSELERQFSVAVYNRNQYFIISHHYTLIPS